MYSPNKYLHTNTYTDRNNFDDSYYIISKTFPRVGNPWNVLLTTYVVGILKIISISAPSIQHSPSFRSNLRNNCSPNPIKQEVFVAR